MSVWKLEIEVADRARDAFERALEELLGEEAPIASTELREGETWRVEAYLEALPDQALLGRVVATVAEAYGVAPPSITLTELGDVDWVAENQRSFLPFSVGRFFVYPSFHQGGVPRGSVGILIDPGMAFGTGTHPTTQGCLMAIDELASQQTIETALDVGCGSGILAIALAHVAKRRVMACDNDPVAVRITEENARLNRVENRIVAVQSDGLYHPEIAQRVPFQLIVANILAQPLIDLAPNIVGATAPGGTVVLSGLLDTQEAMVLEAYRSHGLTLARRIEAQAWRTLVLRR